MTPKAAKGVRGHWSESVSNVTQPITAEQLLKMPDNHVRRELIAGEIREMPLEGFEHGYITANFAASLALFVGENNLGVVVAGGTGFILARGPDTVRAPDVAFVSRKRLEAIPMGPGYFPGLPDLAVEVISPNDTYTEVESKVEDWLNAGCRLVVVANPRTHNQTLKVYRKLNEFSVLTVDDTFDGGDVVPGFRFGRSLANTATRLVSPTRQREDLHDQLRWPNSGAHLIPFSQSSRYFARIGRNHAKRFLIRGHHLVHMNSLEKKSLVTRCLQTNTRTAGLSVLLLARRANQFSKREGHRHVHMNSLEKKSLEMRCLQTNTRTAGLTVLSLARRANQPSEQEDPLARRVGPTSTTPACVLPYPQLG